MFFINVLQQLNLVENLSWNLLKIGLLPCFHPGCSPNLPKLPANSRKEKTTTLFCWQNRKSFLKNVCRDPEQSYLWNVSKLSLTEVHIKKTGVYKCLVFTLLDNTFFNKVDFFSKFNLIYLIYRSSVYI